MEKSEQIKRPVQREPRIYLFAQCAVCGFVEETTPQRQPECCHQPMEKFSWKARA